MTDENLCNNEKVVSQNRPKQEVLVANFQQQQQQKSQLNTAICNGDHFFGNSSSYLTEGTNKNSKRGPCFRFSTLCSPIPLHLRWPKTLL